jgi:hypothetical protein
VLGHIRSLFRKEAPARDWLNMNEVIQELTVFLLPNPEIELQIRIAAISCLSWTIRHGPRILPAKLEVAVHAAERIPSTSMGQSATRYRMA